jgi:hypothetical protein
MGLYKGLKQFWNQHMGVMYFFVVSNGQYACCLVSQGHQQACAMTPEESRGIQNHETPYYTAGPVYH